jgi:hypothetical protein
MDACLGAQVFLTVELIAWAHHSTAEDCGQCASDFAAFVKKHVFTSIKGDRWWGGVRLMVETKR